MALLYGFGVALFFAVGFILGAVLTNQFVLGRMWSNASMIAARYQPPITKSEEATIKRAQQPRPTAKEFMDAVLRQKKAEGEDDEG